MDTRKFEHILIPYKPRLLRYANSFVKDSDMAKDVVQDVYTKLWAIRNKLNPGLNLEALMMKITKNLSINVLRKEEYARNLRFSQSKTEDTPWDHLVFNDTKMKIESLIERLPDVQRELIHLHDKEGFSQDEISMITGYDKNYIRVNLSRARKKLKALYQQLLDYEQTR